MQKLSIVFSLLLALGCQTASNKEKPAINATDTFTGTITDADKPVQVEGCYMDVLKRDTFTAMLYQQGNTVSGKLVFNNYEKDRSSGSVTGSIKANILRLNYRFWAEGMNSILEVYFKYKDGNLIRGIGETGIKGDSAYFKNPAAVLFEGSILKKIPCEKLPVKYR